MSMHKAEMCPKKDLLASTTCTVVLWSVATMCAGFGFFGAQLVVFDHIDQTSVTYFAALSAGLIACWIPYSYTYMRWAVCERCFSYVCFKKDVGVCRDCEARYIIFHKNVFRDTEK